MFIPPGAPSTRVGHPLIRDNHPPIQFPRNSKWTCLFSSFASALQFLGLSKTAAKLASEADKFSVDNGEGWNNWNALLEIMKADCRWLVPVPLGRHFDILNNQSMYPAVAQLEAADGGVQHAITVVGKLIFDSNCARALPLSKESLDHCCSSDEKSGSYQRVLHGYRFEEHKMTKKKRLKKLNVANPYWKLVQEDDL